MKRAGAETRSGMVAIATDLEIPEHSEAKSLWGDTCNNYLLLPVQAGVVDQENMHGAAPN